MRKESRRNHPALYTKLAEARQERLLTRATQNLWSSRDREEPVDQEVFQQF